jgi:hypothetical protein
MSDSGQRINPNVLGIILGAVVVAMVVTLIILFSRHGLPKDPDAWQRLQQQRSAGGNP